MNLFVTGGQLKADIEAIKNELEVVTAQLLPAFYTFDTPSNDTAEVLRILEIEFENLTKKLCALQIAQNVYNTVNIVDVEGMGTPSLAYLIKIKAFVEKMQSYWAKAAKYNPTAKYDYRHHLELTRRKEDESANLAVSIEEARTKHRFWLKRLQAVTAAIGNANARSIEINLDVAIYDLVKG